MKDSQLDYSDHYDDSYLDALVQAECTACEWSGDVTECVPDENDDEAKWCPECGAPVEIGL